MGSEPASARGGPKPQDPHAGAPLPTLDHREGARASDFALLIWADALGDMEAVRIATQGRLREFKNGKKLATPVEIARLEGLLFGMTRLEKEATKGLQQAMKRHPLGPWVARTVGVGEKQAGRLLAALEDPSWNKLHGRDRTVGELWAYCGFHVVPADQRSYDLHAGSVGGDDVQPFSGTQAPLGVVPADHATCDTQSVSVGRDDSQLSTDVHLHRGVAPRRRKGQKGNWNAIAKTRAYLIAESCMKQSGSPYRAVYEHARAKYAEAVHTVDCAQCKAKAGSPLSKGHQHARALRIVAKEILKDLWVEARLVRGL